MKEANFKSHILRINLPFAKNIYGIVEHMHIIHASAIYY